MLEAMVADAAAGGGSPVAVDGRESASRCLVEWNATEAEYPQDRCIQELFEEQVQRDAGWRWRWCMRRSS